MKGAKDPDTLDEEFGEGNWFKAPAPPCRHEVGTRDIVVKRSAKRKEHVRTIKVYENMQRCHCQWEQGVLAAKSPDLNLAENFFNEVQSRLRKMGISIGWPKNREELIKHIVFNKKMPNGQMRKDVDLKKMKKFFPNFKFISLFDGIREIYNKKINKF